MNLGDEGSMTAEAATAEIERASSRVRRRGRWPGVLWLSLAVVIFVFFVATGSGNQLLTDIAGPIPLLAAAVGYLLARRQPVLSGRGSREDRLLSYAFLGAVVVATAIKLTVLPQHFTVWLVVLGFLMSVPALVAAWRWLRP